MGSLLSVLAGLFGRAMDSADLAERNKATEAQAVASVAAAAERAMGPGRGWFGALVDGYTRLMRPAILTLALVCSGAIVYLSYTDPLRAATFFDALGLGQDFLLICLAPVFAYFGIRPIEKASIAARAADAVLSRQVAKGIVENKKLLDNEDRLEKEMADNTKPLSNWAIVEINKKRGNL